MFRYARPVLLLLFFPCFAVAHAASAAELHQPGFRTFGQWRAEDKLRLDVNVWYPSAQPPRVLNYAPWEITAALGGKPAEGRFPLLLLSHDSGGTRFSYHDTAARLASRGFVVAAVTHPADCMYNMDSLFTLAQLRSRALELSATLDLLLESPQAAQGIDRNRIGLIGFGAGAAAALLLGGALPDCAGWPDYCGRAGSGNSYCSPWAKERISRMCAELPLTASLADPRIKAVAAVAPGYGMLFGQNSFRHFYPPLFLIGAENDRIHPPALHADALDSLLNGRARHVTLKEADAASLAAPCPESLEDELPELCRSVSSAGRKTIHQQLQGLLSDFFLHYLGNDKNLPIIPSPPDLAKQEAPVPASVPPPAPERRKQRKNR
jgi:predicted dienelactone hydrolase